MKPFSFLLLLLLIYSGTLSAQLPYLIWDLELDSPPNETFASADLDNDGKPEIIVGTSSDIPKFYCLNAEDGSIVWEIDQGCLYGRMFVEDVDNDGQMDILFNNSCQGSTGTYCLDGSTGNVKWSVPYFFNSGILVEDMEQDGSLEVIFAYDFGNILILNAENGGIKSSIEVTGGISWNLTDPVATDIDGDGDLEIIIQSLFYNYIDNLYYTWAVDPSSGSILWEYTTTGEGAALSTRSPAVLSDLDGDDDLEYLQSNTNGTFIALHVEDGTPLWQQDYNQYAAVSNLVTDIDRDGELEIITQFHAFFDTLAKDSIIILDALSGDMEWSLEIPAFTTNGVSLTELNGNQQPDLLLGSSNSLFAIEPYNGLLWELPLEDNFPPQTENLRVRTQTLLADFNQNSNLNLLVTSSNGGGTLDSSHISKAILLELDQNVCSEWTEFQYDIQYPGIFDIGSIEEDCLTPTMDITPFGESLMLFPNPAEDILNIQYYLQTKASVKAEVFDALGRNTGLQANTENDLPMGGQAEWQWNTQQLAPGIYFIQFNINGSLLTRKFVIQR
ncbi:MAG: PQQ-binding-like beta-propeller repeat protein [Bacteroidetes bacterium]|nr:PQQ-binding-like beta-propeller repeat protein [Bacteroidota bacterium]